MIRLTARRLAASFPLARTESNQRQRSLESALESSKELLPNKTTFLSTMSHGIRTPLNGVTGMISIPAETHLNVEQLEIVNMLRSSSEVLLNVVNGILDYTRLGKNKLTIESVHFNVQLMIDEIPELVRVTAQRKGILLKSKVDPTVSPALIGDVSRLKQVLLNLLSNAILHDCAVA